jgi:hypothetical protein
MIGIIQKQSAMSLKTISFLNAWKEFIYRDCAPIIHLTKNASAITRLNSTERSVKFASRHMKNTKMNTPRSKYKTLLIGG